MDFTKVFVGGAFVATIVSCWGYIKDFIWKFFNIFIKRINVYSNTASMLTPFLVRNYKYSSFYDKVMTIGDGYFLKKNKISGVIGYEDFAGCNMIFWTEKRILWGFIPYRIPFYFYNLKSDKVPIGAPTCQIYYMRGTLNIEELYTKCVDYINNRIQEYNNIKERFYISHFPSIKRNTNAAVTWDFDRMSWIPFTHEASDLGYKNSDNEIENLVLTEENEKIIRLGKLWKNNRDWYKDKNISWKMGWALHGPPGTGKTSIAKRVAQQLDVPIFVFHLGLLSSQEFTKHWQKMKESAPCVALIEDFDNIFDLRENVSGYKESLSNKYIGMSLMKSKDGGAPVSDDYDDNPVGVQTELTFDTFLNIIDGVESSDGIFLIITTNHIEKMDDALAERPGRIDKVIKLDYLTYENKFRLVDKLLSDMPDLRDIIRVQIEDNPLEQLTPAKLQERCTSLALAHFYKE